MTDSNKNIPTDIWGDSTEGKHECFYCGEYYFVSDSTAPDTYQSTYCTKECYEKDSLQMKMTAEAEARYRTHENPESSPNDSEAEAYTTTKIGDFVLKVKKGHTP